MTIKADIVDPLLLQVMILRAVIVMAAAAAHLFFPQRMTRRQHGLSFLFLMTRETQVRISQIHHFGPGYFMRLVAVVAPDTVIHMHIGPPVHGRLSLMAGQAHLRALLGRELGKADDILRFSFGL